VGDIKIKCPKCGHEFDACTYCGKEQTEYDDGCPSCCSDATDEYEKVNFLYYHWGDDEGDVCGR